MSHEKPKNASILIGCMDYRFWEKTVEYIKKRHAPDAIDLGIIAGGAKQIAEKGKDAISVIFKEIEIARDLHGAKTIFLVNHQDCGAYGGSKAFENIDEELDQYKKDLLAAKDILNDEFPSLKVILMQVRFDEDETISLHDVQ